MQSYINCIIVQWCGYNFLLYHRSAFGDAQRTTPHPPTPEQQQQQTNKKQNNNNNNQLIPAT